MTQIGDRAFYGCKKLKELSIPGAVNKVGEYAFSNTGLTTITLGEGITELCDDMFYYCEKLENVSIPDTVKEINETLMTYS